MDSPNDTAKQTAYAKNRYRHTGNDLNCETLERHQPVTMGKQGFALIGDRQIGCPASLPLHFTLVMERVVHSAVRKQTFGLDVSTDPLT